MKDKYSLKEKIFFALSKQDYLTDTEVAKICGGEPNWSTVEEYKRQFHKLRQDVNFFKDKKIIKVSKHKRLHLAELDNGDMYKIGADFYNEMLDILTNNK